MTLTGIHHLTAVSADARGNHTFYTSVLGMRLVKKTVNQDDTSAYHLFYGDGAGTPGSDITFFDWPAQPEQRGTNAVIRTALRVTGEDTLGWWAQRFDALGVRHQPVRQRHGRATLDFEDPEGQRLSLVDDGGAGDGVVWEASPVPAAHQIRGLGHITLSVRERALCDNFLTTLLGLKRTGSYTAPEVADGDIHVYEIGAGGPNGELHIAEEPHKPVTAAGAGGVHHVALRLPTFEAYEAWAGRLRDMRYPNSGPVDRYYFRSLYMRSPNGVLFELATDGPGFDADEPMATLGEKLSLPPFLEPKRSQIEAGLTPLDPSS